MKRILTFALLITLAGCSAADPAKPAANKDADLASINKLRDDFIAAFNANDATKVGDVYSADAITMAADQPTAKGRQAIVDANKAMFEQVAAKVTLTPEQTEVFGDNGFDRGTFSMAIAPKAKGAKPMTNEGRYLVLVHREAGGAWKVTTDIDNSSKPATAAPAAKAKTVAAKKAKKK
jgi:uncharacterized protein (TIGR02246 family)